VIPIKDNVPTRRFPVVTVALIVGNALVWIFYEHTGGAGLLSAVNELAYHPCEVEDSCVQVGEDWPITVFTSMFMHASWAHIIGNMLFLWIFGNNVEDTLGRVRFLVFYLVGGLAATAVQTFVTLQYGSPEQGLIPNLGASGAISAVLGAYFVLFPHGKVLTFVPPFFFFAIPAFVFLGIYFVYQLIVGGASFVSPETGGGVAYFAHLGGIAFGLVAAKPFAVGRPRPPRPTY
jgi:membrane associated rhomboid family serine protease